MKHIHKYRGDDKSIVIDLCKSAPVQIQPVPRIEELCEYWKDKGYREVIDVGCGWLRNALLLVEDFDLWICDFKEQFTWETVTSRLANLRRNERFKGIIYPEELANGDLKVDAAFISFVLHIIPSASLRRQLLRQVIKNLKPPHEVFIAVPSAETYYRRRLEQANRLNDGYLFNIAHTEHTTFYRDYTAKELDEFMGSIGLRLVNKFPACKKQLRVYQQSKKIEA